ncbi:hypothetical protein CampHawk_208 [Bacillus phage CampHawk]|uniref:Uncharacterized protein n=1 Tax=Bacillus phage CampHawk TaxID=1406783 RepID=U5PTL8_9CAUD|nr:hypothetical protein CampHawk_7 [Bacillus phage CampHawk]YP_008770142.1 hypothetical protein CampHawk_208 [Bacillus phage CampHawk]AGY46885.1 hypothetical protein CampHawk_7 [Bacillus phage CampHawk]AGY47086.1 hypothetical protein CampHawk_208 [Bacillus phage CampHawk]
MAKYLNVDILVNHKDKKYKANGYLAPSKGDLILALIDGELEAAEVKEVADIVGSQLFVKSPNSNDKKGYKFIGQYLVLKPYGSSDPRGDILVHEGAQYVRVDARAMPGDLIEVLEPNKLPFNGKRFKYRPAVLEVEYVRANDPLQLEDGVSYDGAYRVLLPRMGVLPPKTHRYTTHKHVFMKDAFVLGNSYEISDGETVSTHAVFTGFSKSEDKAIFINPYYNEGSTNLEITVNDLLTGKWDITPLVPKKGV